MTEKPVSFEILPDLGFSTQSALQLLEIEAFSFSKYNVGLTFLTLSFLFKVFRATHNISYFLK